MLGSSVLPKLVLWCAMLVIATMAVPVASSVQLLGGSRLDLRRPSDVALFPRGGGRAAAAAAAAVNLSARSSPGRNKATTDKNKPATTTSPASDEASASSAAAAAAPPSLRVMQSSSFLLVLSLAIVSLSPTPILIDRLGSDKAMSILSTLAAFAATLEIVLSPVLGATLDSLGRKPALVGSMASVSVAHTVAAFRPETVPICAARCVGAVAVSQFFVASSAVIGDVTAASPESMGSYLGTQSALVSGGFVVGVMAAGRLNASLAGRLPGGAYGISAVLAAAAAIFVFLGMEETLPVEQRVPFEFSETRRRVLESPISAAHLLIGRGNKIRMLSILLLLQSAPMFMGDVIQVLATKEWGLAPQGFANLIAVFGLSGIVANMAGSVLIRKMGVQSFTSLAILSSLCFPIGASLFSHRGAILGAMAGFLGSAQTVGVVAALTAQASALGVRQGELAGERASLLALMKIVCPIWYGRCLYPWGQRAGLPQLPFVFNIFLTVSALALAQWSLT